MAPHLPAMLAASIKASMTVRSVEATLICAALFDVLELGEVVQDIGGDKASIFLAGLHAAERMIAERLLRRAPGAGRATLA